ncbi:MAG: hypothetical protein A2381_18895 [Bdellovibrionales bacterium RIFOXYB1_FULL_37_110]|nr:MAG: hypothetical protein A2181_05205 [Bdellovibrionales bacterium RIFOXYA1_FULL_38_20]OFZ46573.1 MAG: hypothetical protein A2417_13900 [Bdellovibrionales bacterium RIFOXYC1_FULL_37_79]OFZ57695.1 MAG: hypothetical protein A2381_18895 [Bdellovibrionales bacterium RIFOXYB1_FULL_37_110]OFZ62951.1 MAG: hypothetical protein A2577_11550 [Bdellovibrionales bacterium RIFOXYD1_FULL_36_51]OFZ63818.1 MAG: hypothetical protein A2328_06425 [Bdellovibrionales bacterium RIFOXYB2_FULL_36_6]
MTKKEASIVETEQGFNEAELENIMSEIESLEEEFVNEGASSSADLAIDKESAPSNDFQDEVDKALNHLEDEDLSSFEKDIAQVNEEMSAMTNTQTSPEDVTLDSPIVPTEQVIEVKKKLDTSALFAEFPAKKSRETGKVSSQVDKKQETVIMTKNISPDSSFEDAVTDSMNSVEMETSTKSETNSDNVVPFNFNKETKMSTKGTQGNCDTTMNFTVSGQMNLNLNFTVGGQEIQLTISEGEGFCISMGNGVKFSVPIEQKSTLKQQKAS